MRHDIQWTAPPPFWGRSPDLSETGRAALRSPALLRFASDAFMEEFNRTLESDPSKLTDLEAQFETWRGPQAASAAVPELEQPIPAVRRNLARLKVAAERRIARASAVAVLDPPPLPATQPRPRRLKLYQPAHQRFYLVAASLVCRQPGLPDRAVNTANQEKTTFVLRRVRTVSGARAEYGFIPAAGGGTWTAITHPERALADKEETLPLFAVNFKDDAGLKRRVLAGLVPVGRREAYVGAALTGSELTPPSVPAIEASSGAADPGAPATVDPRAVLLNAEVIEPWKTLVARAEKARQVIDNPGDQGSSGQRDAVSNRVRLEAREAIQVGSWYILLDFARFLNDHLNEVYLALPTASPGLSGKALDVWNALNGTTVPLTLRNQLQALNGSMTVATSLREALAAVTASGVGPALEAADGSFTYAAGRGQSWPAFLFPLSDPAFVGGVTPPLNPALPPGAQAPTIALRKISALRDLIGEALPREATGPVPDLPLAAKPVLAPDETARFVLRCVFQRPNCDPINPIILSAPSREFELANFFDPEAPARPIRIALPVDTSPAGLRRAPKNTAFMVSDMLCGHVAKAKSMGLIDLIRAVLPFPLHKALDPPATACKTDPPELSLGMICSLSIPIVTICAFILLIIIVSLLDMIFKWMPYFIFCFPFPKFSAKPPAEAEP